MREALRNFYNDVARKKAYWIPILFFAMLAYGFSMTNRTVGIDDLLMDFYIGSGHEMLSSTRWGMSLWIRLCSTPVFMPFVRKFLAVCFLVCGSSVAASILHYVLQRKNVWSYTIFSSLMITYPLIHEIFEFDGANMMVGGNFMLAAFALLFIIASKRKTWVKLLLASLPLALGAASYETGVSQYILLVLIYLFCKYVIKNENSRKLKWLREGLTYAIPLVIAFILRVVIGVILIKLYGIEYKIRGAAGIYWGTNSFLTILGAVVKGTIQLYVLNGLVYFPITVFDFAVLIFTIGIIVKSIRRRGILPFILGVLIMISIFSLGIVQGEAVTYRTAETPGLFLAFVGWCVLEVCYNTKKKPLAYVATALCALLCLHQASYLNHMLALNNQRSDNEMAIVHELGAELKSGYEDKPVVFVGTYELGEWINSELKPDPDTIGGKLFIKAWKLIKPNFDAENNKFVHHSVLSIFNWASKAYTVQTPMRDYFSYCGFDIEIIEDLTEEEWEEYNSIAIAEGLRPYEIRDMGEYILVCLGELEAEA